MPRKCAAFSLLELLICVALIMIGNVMMFGAGSKFGQTRRKAACAVNLAQMHMALSLYAAEHDGVYPVQAGATNSEGPLSELVPRYTTDTSAFICPGNKTPSYAYYMGLTRDAAPETPLVSDAQVDVRAKQKGDAVFSANGRGPGNNHRAYGGNILFVDGHVETGDATARRNLPIPNGAVLLNPKS